MKTNHINVEDGVLTVELFTALNVNNISFIYRSIDDLFTQSSSVKIIISNECNEFDITALQLLYALSAHCRTHNKHFIVENNGSEAFQNGIQLSGAEEMFKNQYQL